MPVQSCQRQKKDPVTIDPKDFDTKDFERLVQRYQDPLFGFLGRMGFDQASAEDLAQDTFLRAWRNRASYDANKASVSTWLFTIARNLALNKIDHDGRRKTDSTDIDSLVETDGAALLQDSHEQGLRKKMVHSALAKLDVGDRSVIALAYLRELTSIEAAQILECSPAAFRTRLTRARQRLAKIIKRKS